MIYVVASIKVRPGKISAFLERFKAIVPNAVSYTHLTLPTKA